MKRLRTYILSLLHNGFFFFTAWCLILYFLIPTNLYFQYGSVESDLSEVSLFSSHIDMTSRIDYNVSEYRFEWNDELRCKQDDNDTYDYIDNFVTSSESPTIRRMPYVSPWDWRGEYPEIPAECVMKTTITKYIYGFIPKRQIVYSEPFNFVE